MYLIENYTLAVIFTVVTMICWGSWQNIQNLVEGWRFELFYIDFTVGIFIFSLFMAFTFGSFGDGGRSFITDLSQAKLSNLLSACFGGFIWSIGTLLVVAAIAIAGMSVAFPIAGGIGWVLGIITSYAIRPESNPLILFSGTLFILGAIILSMLSYKRLSRSTKKPPLKGILLSVSAGLCLAFFYSFVAQSLDPDFTIENAGKISPYTAVVLFSVGANLAVMFFVPVLMARPVEGSKLTFSDYYRGTTKEHFLGIVAGLIWGLGNSLSFMAANAASPAISYALSNAAVVVAAVWGIFIWKEFKMAPKGTNIMLAFMFVCYLIGLVLVVLARF